MKRLKKAKKFLMLLTAGTVLTGTMLIVNAGDCNHGGETSAFETYKKVAINCISAGTHACYVGGKETSCEMYCYKYMTYERCKICGEVQSYYSYGPIMHQYNH